MYDFSTLASNLLERRRQLGYTQKQLAARSGVSVYTIRKLEHGCTGENVYAIQVYYLSKALDCRIAELFE